MSTTKSRRAAPLAAPERRAAIVDATIPLLRRHGRAVTTRQIAAAAGIAEGTVFSVFDDKESLIDAAVEAALDPAPVVEAILALDPPGDDHPVEEALVAAVKIIQDHIDQIWQLLSALGPTPRPRRSAAAGNEVAVRQAYALEPLLAAVADQLRRPPADAAAALVAMTAGCSHPAIVLSPLPPHEIVDLFLDGVRRPRP